MKERQLRHDLGEVIQLEHDYRGHPLGGGTIYWRDCTHDFCHRIQAIMAK